ncbi:CAP domain-containing protein [Aquibacillus koreensis]|uniref:CAP domain-containing protein n=1 Tax=Aquibacillus koreensis TaxID=279446 RepID=A0A9X4AJR7_9BACI|nr:CAP domain-containing protein [Aquibacillus koreensis]MCT2538085.1 CAP domain-containing protein [Aquibacillus koreensis]MDC3420608.1 CAP domain-containing protein [Aquibacillus koreensis]
MKGIKGILLFLLICGGIFYVIEGESGSKEVISNFERVLDKKMPELESKTTPLYEYPVLTHDNSLLNWVGRDVKDLIETFGHPNRKDKSSYGYIWWVYTNQNNQHMQFGVNDDKIQTIFATGDQISIEPVEIGQTYEEVKEYFEFNKEVIYSTYRFSLKEKEIKLMPLVKLDEDTFVQFYFDSFTDQLSSIRILTSDLLLLQRPYEVFYRGKLPSTPLFTDDEWHEIELGMERQIFDISNVIRSRFNKPSLAWHKPLSEVAFSHSKDMADNNYFSHYSQNGKSLKDRLDARQINYYIAGENIAAQYVDGPAAVEGWLNSEGHRDALLKDEYTHLGVGVYQYYYTQNFLHRLDEEY